MIRIIAPFILYFLFISESIFSLVAGEWFYQSHIYSPKFVLIALIFLAFYGPKNYYVGYALLFGALTDIVYSEVIGIYLLAYPVVCYLVYLMRTVVQNNYIIALIISLVGVALVESFSYLINLVIRMTTIPMEVFIASRLLPTLLFNAVFLVIAMYFLRKMAEKIKGSIEK